MAKFLIIKGNVRGGHNLTDLGTLVPFGEEVTLNLDRASWSRDLNHAIQQGLVKKVRIVNSKEHKIVRKAPKRVVNPAPKTSSEPDEKPTQGRVVDDENQELRRMNEALIQNAEALVEQQHLLMEKLQEFMDRPQSVTIAREGATVIEGSSDSANEEVPHFIPSKIRKEGLSPSSDVAVSSSKGSSKKMTAATDALRKLRENSDASTDD